MAASIVAAQGYGLADRKKTCVRVSTEARPRPGERRRKNSLRGAPDGARSTEDPRNPVRNLGVGDGRKRRNRSASLVKGEGDDSFILI